MEFDRREIRFPDPGTGRSVRAEAIAPGSPGRGTVLLMHGLGDHVGRHEWVKTRLCRRGYGVLGIDWPGCGHSEGVRGDLPLLEDAVSIVDRALAEAGVVLVGAIGHSTGAFYLARFLSRGDDFTRNMRWAWFSSSLVRPDAGQGPIRIALARLLSSWFPTLTLSTHVRRDDCYHTAAGEDPDHLPAGVHSRISLRFGAELLTQASEHPRIGESLPEGLAYLVTHGLSDHVCPPRYVEEFYSRIRSGERTFLLARGARHEPFREPESASFLSAVDRWLDRRAAE